MGMGGFLLVDSSFYKTFKNFPYIFYNTACKRSYFIKLQNALTCIESFLKCFPLYTFN